MEEDYFEKEFEDELDALNDLEMEENLRESSETRRSLFGKSSSKHAGPSADISPQLLQQTPDRPVGRKRQSSAVSPDAPHEHEHTPTRSRGTSACTAWKRRKTADGDRNVGNKAKSTSRRLDGQGDLISHPPLVARKQVLGRIPAGEYMPVTATDGVRSGYMAIPTDEIANQHLNQMTSASRDLLGVDFTTLKEQVQRKRTSEVASLLDSVEECTANSSSAMCEEGDEDRQVDNRLWVDLYSPKRYMDLMSDEAVNRALLKWVKMWDHVVFKKQRPVTRKPSANPSSKTSATGKGNKLSYKEFMKKKYEDLGLEEEYDKLYRPAQKVVLLCGRPGLGKTTLAHVVARHAGYNVIEMNASDERNAQSLRDKVDDSLTTRPLLGSADPRPNCLIIDEIDGAPAPAINALLTMINAGDSVNEQKRKKKAQESPLLRPVICICNDLYTPALRPLRQHALVLNFPSQCPSLLASRLLEICRCEGLGTDMSTLMALCDRSSSDIRSCLNTLQFIRRRQGQLTMKEMLSLSVGAKDEQRSLFSFWQHVFQLPSKSRNVMPSVYDDLPDYSEDDNSVSSRFERIVRAAQGCGEFNRLVQGLHENFPNMKYKDSSMTSVKLGMEWLCYTDLVNKRITSQQAFTLYRHLPYLSVVFHLLFSQASPPKIVYPKVHFDVSVKKNHMMSLLSLLSQDMLPAVSQYVRHLTLTLDILPLLVDVILQPGMRPVNIQLYSANEKAVLRHLVSIMIAYNLTYSQQKTSEGTYTYSLEPPMQELVRYTDIKQTRKALSYTAKQLIASELQQEKQRRIDQKSSQSTPSTKVKATPKRNKETPSTPSDLLGLTPRRSKDGLQEQITPNHKQKLMPKNITPSQKEARDFFGRPVDKATKQLSAEAAQAQRDTALFHTDIFYKYKEGYSNAVRRKITINDLL